MVHRRPHLPITVTTGCGRVSAYRLPGRSVVIFTGEIDVAFRDEPFDRIVRAVAAAGDAVYVDCSGVTFFGAEGLRMMDDLVQATREHRLAGIVTSRAVEAVGRVYPIGRYRLSA